MIKFFDGNGRQTTSEAVMNYINLYLNGRQGAGTEENRTVLLSHLEEFSDCIEQMEEEFDLLRGIPVCGSGLKGKIQSVVAKCTGWYMKDILRKQTAFNLHLLTAMQREKMILEKLLSVPEEEER